MEYRICDQSSGLAPCIANLQIPEGAQAFADGTADAITGIVIDGNKITLKFTQLDPNVLLPSRNLPRCRKSTLPTSIRCNSNRRLSGRNRSALVRSKQEVQMNEYTVMVPFEDYHGGVAKIEEMSCIQRENDANVVKNAAAANSIMAIPKMWAMSWHWKDEPHARDCRGYSLYASLFINKFPRNSVF
jgi:peptide/nickel transport system substrate-binding protein